MRTLFLLIIMMVILSCSQPNKTQVDTQVETVEEEIEYLSESALLSDVYVNEVEKAQKIDSRIEIDDKDTIVRFTFRGKTKEYLIDKMDYEFMDEFQRFVYNVGDVFKYKNDGYIDITGDGNKNYFSTIIEQRPNGFMITNTIKDKNKTIWLDSMLVDDRLYYLYLLSEGGSLFHDTKPYSCFYTAYKISRVFISDPPFYEPNRELHLYWLNRHVSDPGYWESYLDNFKGQTIFHLCTVAPHEYIWDSRTQSFVPIRIP